MQFQIVIIATLQSVSQEMLSSSILTVLDDVKQGVCHDNTLNETYCFIQNYRHLKIILLSTCRVKILRAKLLPNKSIGYLQEAVKSRLSTT